MFIFGEIRSRSSRVYYLLKIDEFRYFVLYGTLKFRYFTGLWPIHNAYFAAFLIHVFKFSFYADLFMGDLTVTHYQKIFKISRVIIIYAKQ